LAVETFTLATPGLPGPPRGGRRSMVVYERLQRDIVLGSLAPGTGLLELELAERFGCSQSTVREALLLLQEEGLVVRVQHRGTHVSESRRDDALELLHLRHDIECRAVGRVLAAYDARLRAALLDRIDAMRAAARADDEYLLSLHDRAFHLGLHEAAGLPSVQPILQRCLVHNHRYKILTTSPTAPGGRDLSETAERHVAIVQALDSRDVDRATAALSHHVATIVDLGPRLDHPFQGPRLAWPPEAR
jgi:GntR family transcriptional regulator, rspAB operon transcriptional repressor